MGHGGRSPLVEVSRHSYCAGAGSDLKVSTRPDDSGPDREGVYITREKKRSWAGEMAQGLRALTVLPKVLSSIPSNHMVAHDHL